MGKKQASASAREQKAFIFSRELIKESYITHTAIQLLLLPAYGVDEMKKHLQLIKQIECNGKKICSKDHKINTFPLKSASGIACACVAAHCEPVDKWRVELKPMRSQLNDAS